MTSIILPRRLILPGTPEWCEARLCSLVNAADILMMAGALQEGLWTVKLWGGAGGTVLSQGGHGGFVSGTIYLSGGDILSVYVGSGGLAQTIGWVPSGGGQTPDPAGGNGGNGGAPAPPLTAGGAGGARTSLYLNGTLLAVAGGGGGAGNRNGGVPGGNAGGLSGSPSPLGGTQTAPGVGGGTSEAPGSPGNGPNGGASRDWSDSVGGAGGGGYYGGGGGGSAGSGHSGGGGGSSYSALLGSAVNVAGPNAADPHYGNGAASAADPATSPYTQGGPGRCVLIAPTGQVYTYNYTGSGASLTVS